MKEIKKYWWFWLFIFVIFALILSGCSNQSQKSGVNQTVYYTEKSDTIVKKKGSIKDFLVIKKKESTIKTFLE